MVLQAMRANPEYQLVTVDEFLSIDFGSDRKFELVDGVIQMMSGGTRAHSRVSDNILIFLGNALRGSGCRPHGANMGLRIGNHNVRYPDVSVYCGDGETPDRDREQVADDPVAVFEVLSPSTQNEDQSEKLDQYREIVSLRTIVFVDPYRELVRVVQRSRAGIWRDDPFAMPRDVELPGLGITIPHDEIFARD